MKLSQVNLWDFRGAGDNQGPEIRELSGIDVLTGPNGSGKTRIIQAIQLALSGRVPSATDDTNLEPIELVTKRQDVDQMAVRLHFDGNPELSSITRTFKVTTGKEKPSVSQGIGLLPMRQGGVKECERAIKEICGEFPYMLDIHEFVRLSDAERQKLIFSLSPISAAWTVDEVIARLKESVDELTADEYADIIDEAVAKAMTNLAIGQAGPDIRKGLDSLELWLKTRMSEVKKLVTQNKGASVVNTQMATTDGKQRMREVADINVEMAGTQKEYDELVSKISKAKNAVDAVKRLAKEKADLQAEIEAAKTRMLGLDKDRMAKEMKECAAEIAQLAAKLIECATRIAAADKDMETIRADRQRVVARIELGKADSEAKQKAIDALECPVCAAHLTPERVFELVELVRTRMIDVCGDRDAINAIDKALEICMEEKKALQVNAQTFTDRNSELSNANYRRAVEIESYDNKLASIKILEDRMAKLNKTKVDGAGDNINILEAEAILSGLKARLDELKEELRAKTVYDTNVLSAKTAALQAKKAGLEQEVLKGFLDATSSIRWEIVKGAVDPIQAEVSELLSEFAAKRGVTFAFRLTDARGNDAFQFGWEIPNDIWGPMFVDFNSLSTAQQLITLTCVLAPLIHRANPSLRILLMDNAEVIDVANREMFMGLLATCYGRFLDSIVVASSGDPQSYEMGTCAKIHVLGMERELAA